MTRAGIASEIADCGHTSVVVRLRQLAAAPATAHEPARPVAGLQPDLRLPVTAAEYVALVDWTGRQLRPDKRGAIAAQAPLALSRIATSGSAWTAHVRGIGSRYWRAVGAAQALADRAAALGQRWLKGAVFARSLETV